MNILDIILVILLLSWIGGFGFSIGGALIHLLLVFAVIILVIRLIGGSARTV